MNDVLLNIMQKIKENYILPFHDLYVTCTTSFDFWMSRVSEGTLPWLLVSSIVHGNPPK